MLVSLKIENLGIIEEAEIEFGQGLNVITGETGSGKSMFVKALLLLFGLVKSNELAGIHEGDSSVEACFELSEAQLKDIRELGFDMDDMELFIHRSASGRGGKIRSLINGRSVPVSELQKLAKVLIEKHGQNSTQRFLATENHLQILDSFSGDELTSLLDTYTKGYRENIDQRNELNLWREKAGKIETELDFLKYQLADIEQAQLQENEDVQLERERNMLQNAEKINMLYSSAGSDLGATDEPGACDLAASAMQELEKLREIDPAFTSACELTGQALIYLNEAGNELKMLKPDSSNAGERLESIEQRLHTVNRLKKKYNDDITGVIRKGEELTREIQSLENVDTEVAEREKTLAESTAKLTGIANRIHEIRARLSKSLEKSITEELRELNMPDALLSVELTRLDRLTVRGTSSVEFFISTNKGSKPMPLERIISGGEMSRIALTIKTMLSDNSTKCLLFDEVDSGIGGKTASYVGKKLKDLSKRQQTICITHSPQVAAYAERHIVVEKIPGDLSTKAEIKQLIGEERLNELARMLSGKSTDISVRHANELLDDIGVLK